MNKSIFDFSHYKRYLIEKLGGTEQRRGLKSKMAQALGCQPTFVSQILHGKAELSLEQADRLNQHFAHSKDESEYFLLLVQKDRAGTPSLRRHFQEQMENVLARRMILTQRLGEQKKLSAEHQSRYYSSWHYAALHIALTIPALQTPEALAESFKLPLKKVMEVLNHLVEIGLAVEAALGKFVPGTASLRTGRDSPHTLRHHANWRQQAIESLDREDLEDLHYSAVVSLTRKDALRLKDKLLDRLKEDVALIKESKEEELFCYSIDLFNLRR